MAKAARAFNRPGLGQLILDDNLQALGVLFRMRMSVSPDSIRETAIICLAGSLAVFQQAPELWHPQPIRNMTLALLGNDAALFNSCIAEARALI